MGYLAPKPMVQLCVGINTVYKDHLAINLQQRYKPVHCRTVRMLYLELIISL